MSTAHYHDYATTSPPSTSTADQETFIDFSTSAALYFSSPSSSSFFLDHPMAASTADDAVNPWSRTLTSHTWRIDLQQPTASSSTPASPPSQEPLAILQLQLTRPPPPSSAVEAVQGGEREVVTVSMDRAAVQRALLQLDELDRVIQLKAGAG
jgi:hypothetical protein